MLGNPRDLVAPLGVRGVISFCECQLMKDKKGHWTLERPRWRVWTLWAQVVGNVTAAIYVLKKLCWELKRETLTVDQMFCSCCLSKCPFFHVGVTLKTLLIYSEYNCPTYRYSINELFKKFYSSNSFACRKKGLCSQMRGFCTCEFDPSPPLSWMTEWLRSIYFHPSCIYCFYCLEERRYNAARFLSEEPQFIMVLKCSVNIFRVGNWHQATVLMCGYQTLNVVVWWNVECWEFVLMS